MNMMEMYNIAERHQDLINPTSDEKVLKIGRKLGLNDETNLIDFGSRRSSIAHLAGRVFPLRPPIPRLGDVYPDTEIVIK